MGSSEPDDFGIVMKLSSTSQLESNDSSTEVKISYSCRPEHDNSGKVVTIISYSPSEPNDFRTVVKMSSSSPSEPAESGTIEKLIYFSPSESNDPRTLFKISSCRPSDPDDCRTFVNKFENLIHRLTLQNISSVKQDDIISMNIKKIAEYKKILNEVRQGREFKEEIQPLQDKSLMYKEKFSECKKMGNKSKQAFKSIFMIIGDLLKQLTDMCDEEINRLININMHTDDDSSIIPHAANIFVSSDDFLCRSVGINLVNKLFPDEFIREPSDTHYLVTIDGILDKITKARKCANWFLHKACNLEILCDDIQYTWIYNSLKLTSYANLMESGADKENMYNIYINLQKGVFENIYLRKLHQGEIDLDESDRKYKLLENRKPRFERSRVCISEHNTPFCELCGWPSTWLKTFKKRGIYIKEAPHWTTKHIWYNEITDESN